MRGASGRGDDRGLDPSCIFAASSIESFASADVSLSLLEGLMHAATRRNIPPTSREGRPRSDATVRNSQSSSNSQNPLSVVKRRRQTEWSQAGPFLDFIHREEVMQATGSSTRQRGLSCEFMADLMPGGFMNSLLEVVKADDTLSLNIRCNAINIYYRGGNLLEVRRDRGGLYKLNFDPNYCSVDRSGLGALPAADPGSLPSLVQEGDRLAIDSWLSHFPLLKCAMDIKIGRKHSYEREFQQLIERSNNCSYATAYFICDIEYVRPGEDGQRLDMVAIHWPVGDRGAKGKPPKLALIEVKFRDAAVGGTSGIPDHVQKLQNAANAAPALFGDIGEEMRQVFNQRMDLGLIRCHTTDKPRHIESMDCSRPEYIILLADHYPASSGLKAALMQVSGLQPQLSFGVKVATANFMGYGIFDGCVLDLDDFRQHYDARITHSTCDRLRAGACEP